MCLPNNANMHREYPLVKHYVAGALGKSFNGQGVRFALRKKFMLPGYANIFPTLISKHSFPSAAVLSAASELRALEST